MALYVAATSLPEKEDGKWATHLTLLSSERIHELAEALCQKARENSLDSATDSPFALLAKDNDIMWSGGTFMFHPTFGYVKRNQLTPSNL